LFFLPGLLAAKPAGILFRIHRAQPNRMTWENQSPLSLTLSPFVPQGAREPGDLQPGFSDRNPGLGPFLGVNAENGHQNRRAAMQWFFMATRRIRLRAPRNTPPARGLRTGG
jgi:hypothetical protein